MQYVADGRFFQIVDGDPTHYQLKDEGLTLALGLAVVDSLRRAERNAHDLDTKLNSIIEPISALDDTADVLLAALTIVTLDDYYNQKISTSLIKGFILLQNPDSKKFSLFSSLARNKVSGFMDAAHSLCLTGNYLANFDWLKSTLIKVSDNNQVWDEMVNNVKLWLSLYSLSIEENRHPNSKIDVQEETRKLDNKVKELSINELKIFKGLTEEHGDFDSLSELAIFLLAGKPLTPFVDSFIKYCFSNALNSCHSRSFKHFRNLFLYNKIDWMETRQSIVQSTIELNDIDISVTGKWSIVSMLRVTGDSEDDKNAEFLAEELTKDREKFKGWSLINNYCSSDPCNPSSVKPNNIIKTSEQYSEIDVSKLRQFMGQSSEDLFFTMACPALARFEPKIAIAKHREFAKEILNRSGFPLRQGLFKLKEFNFLLSNENVENIIKKRESLSNAKTIEGLEENDIWLISQFLLLLAFPLLNAREQTSILLSKNSGEEIANEIFVHAKPLTEQEFINLLKIACDDENEQNQFLLLALANTLSLELSSKTNLILTELFNTGSERVRTQVLGIISKKEDENLLKFVVERKFKATGMESNNSYEAWYGSIILLKAASKGLLSHGEALNLISERVYSHAIKIFDHKYYSEITKRIDLAINMVLGLDDVVDTPNITIDVLSNSIINEPDMFSIQDKYSNNSSISDLNKGDSETNQDFDQRQRDNHQLFLQFKENITNAKATIILEQFSLEDFSRLVAVDEIISTQWYKKFIEIKDSQLPFIHNFILLLAYAFGRKHPKRSEKLFYQIKNSEPILNYTYGRSGLSLDVMALWGVPCSTILDQFRFARLDSAISDFAISFEVLAALMSGRGDLLSKYIQIKLKSKEPAEVSRGLMVVGYSEQSKLHDEIFDRYKSYAGLIGATYKAAKYAYERNIWANHWFSMMCQEKISTEFWRYEILFSKIIDGRFDLWESKFSQDNNILTSFKHTLYEHIKGRINKWKNIRAKKLFGQNIPARIFIS
ncbi:MAG: hypothetical protein QM484_15690 [Woeseiaceae bacterium]